MADAYQPWAELEEEMDRELGGGRADPPKQVRRTGRTRLPGGGSLNPKRKKQLIMGLVVLACFLVTIILIGQQRSPEAAPRPALPFLSGVVLAPEELCDGSYCLMLRTEEGPVRLRYAEPLAPPPVVGQTIEARCLVRDGYCDVRDTSSVQVRP